MQNADHFVQASVCSTELMIFDRSNFEGLSHKYYQYNVHLYSLLVSAPFSQDFIITTTADWKDFIFAQITHQTKMSLNALNDHLWVSHIFMKYSIYRWLSVRLQ